MGHRIVNAQGDINRYPPVEFVKMLFLYQGISLPVLL